MPWKEVTVEEARQQFVDEVMAETDSKTKLCKKYGISRVTGDKWLRRHAEGESMCERSKAPFHTPMKTNQETERKILLVRETYPAWGARKIQRFLMNKGETSLPSLSTMCAILKRNGCVTHEASNAAKPFKRFERERSNELWQTDFKGYITLKDNSICHPLTIIDDCSRFVVCIDAKSNQQCEDTLESFKRAFYRYGMPDAILCDNGNPWGASQSVGYTRFDVQMMMLDILPIHGRPFHPQTQGKNERFNRTLKYELLNRVELLNIDHAQSEFDGFREYYNNIRPHASLSLDTPSTHYTESDRRYSDVSDDWLYPDGFKEKKVKSSGYILIDGQGLFFSEAFGEKTIAIHGSHNKDFYDVYFRNYKVARYSIIERAFVSRKITRVRLNDELC